MLLITNKIRKVREVLKLKQSDINLYLYGNETSAQYNKIEKGHTKPTEEYIKFLINKRVNLNWFFDVEDTREDVPFLKEKSALSIVAEDEVTYTKDCSNCKVKQARIEELENGLLNLLQPKSKKKVH